jgi:hypothetical protein
MDSEYRRYKEMFSKEWPPGCDPPMKAFDYFNKRFQGIEGYNWWLLPSVDEKDDPKHWGTHQDSTITMQFIYGGEFKSMIRSDSWERVSVLVKRGLVLYDLYVDEEGYLFGSMISETCIGRLLQIHRMWDGTAELDTRVLFEYHPKAIRLL